MTFRFYKFNFMRLWSLHPMYLDSKGLVALWREGLLAKKVLENKTKGYKNHPQLIRFRKSKEPLRVINLYLVEVFNEAERRGYNFSKQKIKWTYKNSSLTVKQGQLDYEMKHLRKKLKARSPEKFSEMKLVVKVKTHPLFRVRKGEVEEWEIIS